MSDLIRAVCGLAAICMGVVLVTLATPMGDLLGILIGGVGVTFGLVIAAYYLAQHLSNRHDDR